MDFPIFACLCHKTFIHKTRYLFFFACHSETRHVCFLCVIFEYRTSSLFSTTLRLRDTERQCCRTTVSDIFLSRIQTRGREVTIVVILGNAPYLYPSRLTFLLLATLKTSNKSNTDRRENPRNNTGKAPPASEKGSSSLIPSSTTTTASHALPPPNPHQHNHQ